MKSIHLPFPQEVFFKRFYVFIFRQRGRKGEREGEKHQCVVASHTPPTGDLAGSPGMCPDWELNQGPFGSHIGTKSTEPHQPGLQKAFLGTAWFEFDFEARTFSGDCRE